MYYKKYLKKHALGFITVLICLVLSVSKVIAQQKCYVDVIVAYTNEASAEAGSDSIIVSQISKAVLQANETYVNSGVNHWVRLVRTVKVNYTESGCFDSDLEAFWHGTDDSLALVQWLRNQYHADLAALIITNDQFCGLPVSDTSTAVFSNAFCAVQYKCMQENVSLTHMLAHMYGCGHARFSLDPPGTGVAYPYGHGYHWSFSEDENSSSFRTIMGVNDDENCFGQSEYDCNLIRFFSNPDISYNGVPTGNEYANNAKVLNDNAKLLSDFNRFPVSFIITDTVRTADRALGMALDTLSTGANYWGKDSAVVTFRAGKQIVLNTGFSMAEGTRFETFIDSTVSNCNQPAARKPE